LSHPNPSTERCVHLHVNQHQPSCVIPNPNSDPDSDPGIHRSLVACIACVMDNAETRIQNRDPATAIARDITFNRCPHHREGGAAVCRVCFTALIGSLMLAWGYHRAQPKEATITSTSRGGSTMTRQLRALIAALMDRHGRPLTGSNVPGLMETAAGTRKAP
jgi:hypothetical protein